MIRRALLLALPAILIGHPLQSQEMVGRTAVVVEIVNGILAEQQRRLGIRDDVYQDEAIATEVNSASEIVFLDGTKLAVGPTSKITLSKFIYDPRPSKSKLSLNVAQGLFRFVTGAFSKESYQIETPTSTIGVRGTTLFCSVGGDEGFTVCHVAEGAAIIADKITGQQQTVRAGEVGCFGRCDGRGDVSTILASFAALNAQLAQGERGDIRAALGMPTPPDIGQPVYGPATISYQGAATSGGSPNDPPASVQANVTPGAAQTSPGTPLGVAPLGLAGPSQPASPSGLP